MLLKIFFQFIVVGFLILPQKGVASVFNPQEDTDIYLAGDTRFNYQSFRLDKGLTLNYFAPENSIIEIISEGDIFIGGDLKISADSKLNLYSENVFTLTGTIAFVSSGELEIIAGNNDFSHTNFIDTSAGLIASRGFKLVKSNLLTSYHPKTPYYWSSGSFNTGITLSDSVITTPLPAPFWLFTTALFLLFNFSKKHKTIG